MALRYVVGKDEHGLSNDDRAWKDMGVEPGFKSTDLPEEVWKNLEWTLWFLKQHNMRELAKGLVHLLGPQHHDQQLEWNWPPPEIK